MTDGLRPDSQMETGRDPGTGAAAGAASIADEPRTPRRIALVGAEDDTGLAFLLEDFHAAYAAYSRLAGCDLPAFEAVELGRGADAPADSAVFATDGTFDAEVLDGLARLLGPGTRLHVIFDLDGLDPARADGPAHGLCDLCRRSGALWCGGVAFAAGRPFGSLRRSPRMGLLRRPFSESMDMLVGSARMGCSVRRSQELGGADVSGFDELGLVRATPALPPWLWKPVMHALGRNGHHPR